MKLKQIAHCRAGDKGDTSIVSVIAYRSEDYLNLKMLLTSDAVKNYFEGIVKGPVRRYEIDSIRALNFVMEKSLDGGVTRSLAVDMHGKTLSSALEEFEIAL